MRASLGLGTAASTRAFSWTPWNPSSDIVTPHQAQDAIFPIAVTPGAEDAIPDPIHLESSSSAAPITATPSPSAAGVAAPSPEPILTTPHPDLLNSATPTTLSQHITDNSATVTRSFEELLRASPENVQDVLQSSEAIHAAIKVSDLKLLGLEHGYFNIVGWMRDGLVGMHQITGLPWWLSIAAFTLSLRLALFPMVVRIQAHNARLAAVQPQFAALMQKTAAAKKNNDHQAQQIIAQSMGQLCKEHNVHPLRGLLLPLLQMPLFFSMFWALQKLAGLPLPMLKEGGFGWVTDLTLADPYYILPTTSMLLTLGVLEVSLLYVLHLGLRV